MATTNERKVVGTADVKVNGEVHSGIEIAHITSSNEYQGKTKVSKYFTTAPIPEANIKPTDIRLYPRPGMNEDFDSIIKPLFEGQVVDLQGLTAKSGKSYGGNFIFDMEQVPSFLSKPIYKGVLDFAPREEAAQ